MRATSPARDLQVALARLTCEGDEERAARAWLRARWERQYRRACKRARRRAKRLVPDVVRELRRSLRAHRAPGEASVAFSELLRRAIHEEACATSRALVRAHVEDSDRALHKARIHTKRLRYLLEPLASDAHGSAAPTEQLAALQEQLGDLRDHALLAARLRRQSKRAPRMLHAGVRRLATATAERARLVASAMSWRSTLLRGCDALQTPQLDWDPLLLARELLRWDPLRDI
jgi:CHAD domain-containing protein